MFTGIIEEKGMIQNIQRAGDACVLKVSCREVLKGTHVGDSIAVSGVCLTATSVGDGFFEADMMAETLNRSSLGSLPVGAGVNLERAMPADGRFGGHIVSGHIDGTGTVQSVTEDGNAVWYTIAAVPGLLRYIVEKGSIAIDGISLTVAFVDESCFKVSIIPHTMEMTTLPDRRVGDRVNLECDIIGKYVEKLLTHPDPEKTADAQPAGGLSEEFLRECGF
ncbi:MAG: riboflavin synthase [Lachnospiraceae bacterium]|nr:riboflavin synthase [Lachnospiraceae bacterium]